MPSKQLRIKASHAWMVGNSWRSDVVPALEAGLRVVWIDAHVWEYERSHQPAVDDRVSIVKKLPRTSVRSRSGSNKG
jgi:FMN phosphatase YigB (HAD superfamily)